MDVVNLRTKLEEIATENEYEDNTIEIKAITSAGANFTTQLYFATVSAPNKTDLKLFAKVGFNNEDTREMMNATRLYNTERYVYTELIPEFKKIQEKYDVPEEDRLAFPKCYGVVSQELQETVVLGDLSCEGFGNFDRFTTMDLEYAKEGIRQLAKLHALSFALKEEDPEEFERIMPKYKFEITASEKTHERWGGLVKTAVEALKEEYRPKLMEYLKGHADPGKFAGYYQPLGVPTLIHGDYRTSNLMHKQLDDGSLKIIPVDYQTFQTGCPANDFIYFLFTGTDRQFRKKHLDSLRDYYHSQLGTELSRFAIEIKDVYPRDMFEQEYKDRLPYAVMVGIFVLPIITLGITEDIPKLDSIFDAGVLCGEMYTARFTDIIEDFIEWGLM